MGERLVEAQEFERTCADMYCQHPEMDELRESWLSARQLVEELTSTYLLCCEALRLAEAADFESEAFILGGRLSTECPQ